MNHDEAREVFAASLRQVAPEIDLAAVDHGEPMLDELELDSIDFLSLVTELHRRTGLDLPEADYARLATVADTLQYLVDES